jgi:TolA-binding protein
LVKLRPMHEVDDELREIKREIIESRGLVIKTNNLTNALSADIKSIAKRQQTYERRLSWNSATAYIVFVVVVFAALKFAVDARVDAIEAKYQHMGAEISRLRDEEKLDKEREAQRAASDSDAAKFYDLIRQGKRAEMVDGFESMKKRPLTKTEQAVFADAVERARNEQAALLYQLGNDKTKVQRWQEAASAYEESLRYKDDSTIAPAVRLGLASAYRHLKRQKDAIPILTSLGEQTVDKEVQDDALYLLALCQTDLEAWNDAKNTWRTLIRKFPDSHYMQEAKLNLQQLIAYH